MIAEIIDIDLPRPRRLEDTGREKQAQYAAHIRETFTRVGVFRQAKTEQPEGNTA